MPVSYDKDQHARAKEHGQYLITLAVEGKYAKKSAFAMQGPATPAEAKVVQKAFEKVVALRTKAAEKGAAKGKPKARPAASEGIDLVKDAARD